MRTSKDIIFLVQYAEYDQASDTLIPYAQAFRNIKDAAKFIMREYNASCKRFGDTNTLNQRAVENLQTIRAIQSPSSWGVAMKWTIRRQYI